MIKSKETNVIYDWKRELMWCLGCFIGIYIVNLTTNFVVLFIYTCVYGQKKIKIHDPYDGDLIPTVMTICGIVTCSIIAWVIRKIKKRNIKSYLAFRSVPLSKIFESIGICFIFFVIVNLFILPFIQKSLKNTEPTFENTFLENVSLSKLLFVAVIAPFWEEIVFRGFLFEGISKSKLGPLGAILITALLFSAIHSGRRSAPLVSIFFMGSLLGYLRHYTRSIWIPICFHSFNNLLVVLVFIAKGKV